MVFVCITGGGGGVSRGRGGRYYSEPPSRGGRGGYGKTGSKNSPRDPKSGDELKDETKEWGPKPSHPK